MTACEWCGKPAMCKISYISPTTQECKSFIGCSEHAQKFWDAMSFPLRDSGTIADMRSDEQKRMDRAGSETLSAPTKGH